MSEGVRRIAAERQRQTDKEGWTPEHDAEHTAGELARAAAVYATPADRRKMRRYSTSLDGFHDRGDALISRPDGWPWDPEWWKPCPDDRVRELAKSGALVAAEIDRLLAMDDEVTP